VLLELNDIHVFYGQVEALKGVTLGVEREEIVALIGANGAGKTTTLKMISGVRPARRGTLRFDGTDITKLAGHLRVSLGLSQAPEGRGIFPGMTVYENLEMGGYDRRDPLDDDFDRVFSLFPAWPSGAARWGARCPAASSRCSP
jgi:branched-chain amino acid transport system ATP-binding protein